MRKILEFIKKIISKTNSTQSSKIDHEKTLEILGKVYACSAQENYEDALKLAQSASQKYPTNPKIGLEYAALTERLSGHMVALPLWNNLRRLHPQNVLIQYRYLFNLVQNGDKSKVRKAQTFANNTIMSEVEKRALKIMLEPELGNDDGVIQALEDLVKTDINSNALHALLLHHMSRKNYDAARLALDSRHISNKTYLELFHFSEEINRHKPEYQHLDKTGENAKKMALSFLKKRVKKPFTIHPRKGFNVLVLDKIANNSLETFVQSLIVKCSKHVVDRDHPIKEMALIIGDEIKCDKAKLAELKASRVKITNLALYPSTRAPGTFDPSMWIDDALIGLPEAFIRDTKAITLRFLDTPPEAIYVWRPELLAQTILAAKAAYLSEPVFICLGDALRPADMHVLGILTAAIEMGRVQIIYDNSETARRIAAISGHEENATLIHIGSAEFDLYLQGNRKKQSDLIIALNSIYNQS